MIAQVTKRAILCLLGVILCSGCSSFGKKFKAFLNGSNSHSVEMGRSKNTTSFNSAPSFMRGPKRKYKRTTKKKMAQESLLSEKSGSLWVMEGQGSYLFAQNIMRLVGDSIGVAIDGEPRDQLQSKVNVIGDLYQRLLERRRAKRRLASRAKRNSKAKGSNGAQAKTKENTKPKEKSAENKTPVTTPLSVKIVPSRIIERLHDGNYRVKGSQTFLIGPHQYRVIVTGVVRSEEFSEDGISATRLLDSRFDIVSVKKDEGHM